MSEDIDIRATFAESLRRLMGDNIRPAELARRIGVSQPAVSDWLSAKKLPSYKTINAIMKEYQWTPGMLFGDEQALSNFIQRHNSSTSPFFIGLK